MNRKSIVLILLAVAAVSSGLEWTMSTPPSRCAARMCVDHANQRVILFGGTTVYVNGGYFNDVSEIPLDNPGYYPWLPVKPSGAPPEKRADVCLVYDPVGGRMIMFGGWSSTGSFLNDVWALNLTPGSESWQQLTPAGSPPSGRAYAYAVYCPARRSVVVYGGYNGANVGDVWELKLDTLAWHPISASGAPSERRDGGAVYDSVGNRMLVFGGRTSGSFTNELWALDLAPGGEHWFQLSPSGSMPSARAGFASGSTEDGNKLYVSCGWDPSQFFSDLYVLDVASTTWTDLSPGGEKPLARRNVCGAWDPFAGNFFLYGGECDAGAYLGDLFFADCGNAGTQEPGWQQSGLSGPGLSVTAISGGAVRIHCLVARACALTVAVFDASGRKVRDLYVGRANSPGTWLEWDGKDGFGRTVAPGTYYCSIDAGSTVVSRKLVIAR